MASLSATARRSEVAPVDRTTPQDRHACAAAQTRAVARRRKRAARHRRGKCRASRLPRAPEVAGQLTVEAKPPASVSAMIGRRADCPKMRPSVAKAGSWRGSDGSSEQHPNSEVSGAVVGMDQQKQPEARKHEPIGITRCPPWRSISSPMRGDTSPAVSNASENPAMAKVMDQPCSAAINGTVRTGG